MKSAPLVLILALGCILMVASAQPALAQGGALASQANIFLYPNPHPITNMVLQSTTGRMVSLKDYLGRVVLLRFWSIRCPACKMEEPSLAWLQQNFRKNGLEVLGVNLVDRPGSIMRFVANRHVPFSVLFDPASKFKFQKVKMGGKTTSFLISPSREAILEVPGLPTTYILNPRGQIVGYSVGPAKWTHKLAVNLIQGLIAQRGMVRLGTPYGPRAARPVGLW